jgi:hypothetical protein
MLFNIVSTGGLSMIAYPLGLPYLPIFDFQFW